MSSEKMEAKVKLPQPAQESSLANGQSEPKPVPQPAGPASIRGWHWILLGVACLAGIAATIYFGVPWMLNYFSHESTDDAYVNSYVTYPSPRVAGNVIEVCVDDNKFVEAGQVLLRLDPESYKITRDQKKAALERAKIPIDQQLAALKAAEADVEQARNQVRIQLDSLQVNLDNEKWQRDKLALAEKDHERYAKLAPTGAPEEILDQKKTNLFGAKQQLGTYSGNVRQIRNLLGLPPDQEEMPSFKDLVERVPSVQMAQARALQARAALGGQAFNPDRPYDHPDIRQAQRELDQAELNVGYTEIRAAISGYVSNRAVNKGNQVQVGQMLMAIRPLQEVWIDANFKETQLGKLRIGHPVDIYVDAYPGRVFRGRVAGFNAGTGAAMSLLPPQNATGNFVKVVQRLPVRIELTEPPPKETPLFVGLSVVPEVDFSATPTGESAGERLLGKQETR